MEKNFDVANLQNEMLKSFCNLSRKMEHSGTVVLNLVLPDFYAVPDLAESEDDDVDVKGRGFHYGHGRRQRAVKLTSADLQDIKSGLGSMASALGMNDVEAMLVVAAYTSELEMNASFDMSDIVDYFDIGSIDILPLKGYFDELVSDGVFVRIVNGRQKEYCVDKSLARSLNTGCPYERPHGKDLDRYEFCLAVAGMVADRANNVIPTSVLFEEVDDLENRCSNLKFVSDMQIVLPTCEDRTLFYVCCCDFIETRQRATSMMDTLSYIYDSRRYCLSVASCLMDTEHPHPLIKHDLVERTNAVFAADTFLKLTERGKSLFLAEDFGLFSMGNKIENRLVLPSKIGKKKLFYSPELQRQVDFVADSLVDRNFRKLQARLARNSMPKGVAVMFYGAPGTGKTETAMQLAKATGRKVYHVDISESKSCWFGESEKLVKRIFSDYREMCKYEKVKPILLFNEADALFSKRRDVESSGVAQTENAIQNIILEEMESLDGILVATTNLTNNLDPAFERRFVFKVKFDKPTLEAKQKIWNSKLSWLSDDECRKLASEYDFSGGEIDNVVRKVVMDEVITGNRPDFDFVYDACRNEKISESSRAKIGF